MTVSITKQDNIAIIKVDNPPVNALSQEVRTGLIKAVETIDNDDSFVAAILYCEGRTFIAGADVREFNLPPQEPHLPEVVATIGKAKKPWLAAIHGNALGGGLEVAMACRWRIATADANLGLPEVNLGIIPGANGCLLLPRLVGIEEAIKIIISGKPIKASQGVTLGLIDACVAGDLLQDAFDWLNAAIKNELPTATAQRGLTDISPSQWEAWEAQYLPRDKNLQAPKAALNCIRKASESPFEEAAQFERETFLKLRASEQARALRYLFFAERSAPNPTKLSGVSIKPITQAAVIGGGTMGVGIVIALINAGIPTLLVERDDDALNRGLANIQKNYERQVEAKRMTESQARVCNGLVRGTTDYADLTSVDVVIEAVFEDLEVKRQVFTQLNTVCDHETILATNTSYLDPSEIAKGCVDNLERFIGLHFFSPAHIMKLLEIVPIKESSIKTLATSFNLAKRLKKIPVEAGICDGFIGNRLLKIMRQQAERVLLTGATPSEVDAAWRSFGFPMGPFAAQDLGGLDIAAFQRRAALSRGESVFAPIGDALCQQNRLGQKTSGGWYDYVEGSRTPKVSGMVQGIIQSLSKDYPQRVWNQEDIIDSLLLPMINEAAIILSEGVAQRAEDIDLVEIYGYGFPRWRGGLMCYAENRGLADILLKYEQLNSWQIATQASTALKDLKLGA